MIWRPPTRRPPEPQGLPDSGRRDTEPLHHSRSRQNDFESGWCVEANRRFPRKTPYDIFNLQIALRSLRE